MRLWSLHPKYLDTKGLLAVWREGLLAQSVLLKGEYTEYPLCKGTGKIKTPYWNHPQLQRFKLCKYPLRALGRYLTEIYEEGRQRGYAFDANKIKYFYCFNIDNLTVKKGQLVFEFQHLMDKLNKRDKQKYNQLLTNICQNDIDFFWNEGRNLIKANPIFKIIDGDIESWERINKKDTTNA